MMKEIGTIVNEMKKAATDNQIDHINRLDILIDDIKQVQEFEWQTSRRYQTALEDAGLQLERVVMILDMLNTRYHRETEVFGCDGMLSILKDDAMRKYDSEDETRDQKIAMDWIFNYKEIVGFIDIALDYSYQALDKTNKEINDTEEIKKVLIAAV